MTKRAALSKTLSAVARSHTRLKTAKLPAQAALRTEPKKMGDSQRKADRAARRRKAEVKRLKLYEIEKSSRRVAVQKYFEKFGVWALLKKTSVVDDIDRFILSKPVVVVADGIERTELTERLQKSLTSILNKAVVDIDVLGDGVSICEYYSIVVPIVDFLRNPRSPDVALSAAIKSTAAEHLGNLGTSTSVGAPAAAVHQEFDLELIKHGSIDTGLYRVLFQPKRNDRGLKVEFVIDREPAQLRQFSKDGIRRPAYRCGQPNLENLDWVEWDESTLPEIPVGKPAQVFVQSHALTQLYGRLNAFLREAWMLHEWLWQSLKKPAFAPKKLADGKFLVEYRLFQHKLGYLVGQLIDGAVLIETFLFLTMDGTPEGDLLWKKLKLRKADKDYLDIDTLQFFLVTDVQHDPELVQMLTECGCGNLFQILKEPPTEYVAGVADGVRKHLMLKPAPKPLPPENVEPNY